MLLDEYFAESDDRFVAELLAVSESGELAGLVDRWKVDPRPWARRMQFAYLDAPWRTAGHNVVVKRLYKEAERRHDLELIAGFAHRFDLLIRRELQPQWDWDPTTRQSVVREVLIQPRNALAAPRPRPTPGHVDVIAPNPHGTVLFSVRTRYHLRRRAARVYRYLAFQNPDAYVPAAVQLLRLYRDEDLANGANILDSWSLLQICYRTHPALEFGRERVALRDGHSLQELTPAPRQQHLWHAPAAAPHLWNLLAEAGSRLVRKWAMALLRAAHEPFLRELSTEQARALLASDDDEVQAFAIELLRARPDLGTWSLEQWSTLLAIESPPVLLSICELVRTHVAPERFSVAQLVSLAVSAASPTADLGTSMLRAHPAAASSPAELRRLAEARCRSVGQTVGELALAVLGRAEHYDVDTVVRFFDAPLAEVRAAAWRWLRTDDAEHPGRLDPALFARLLETPYDADRLELVRLLADRADGTFGSAGVAVADLTPLWSAVLLGIHRGGRHKVQALHQLGRAASSHPEHVEALLPVFAVAIRSVRPPEARVGLAALVGAVERVPSLREPVLRTFPELRFVTEEATS